MIELYLIIYDVTTNKEFKKHFDNEYKMDKFIQKLHYSKKLYIIKDSRKEYMCYE